MWSNTGEITCKIFWAVGKRFPVPGDWSGHPECASDLAVADSTFREYGLYRKPKYPRPPLYMVVKNEGRSHKRTKRSGCGEVFWWIERTVLGDQ